MVALEGKPSTTQQRPSNDSPDRLAALERVRRLRETGVSFQQIANTLNQEGTPTLSGRGQWQPGTIGKMMGETFNSRGSEA
ncbi:recombinase family protein [uncultured Thiocystis sp.]|uniref:recombinase family protein n=1 Tax=uncultured Thiocystis sp. TaxID=1202134 RepID=UPI0025E4B282|nr:recombinase family protein [uncultured Thiocystis sp.]